MIVKLPAFYDVSHWKEIEDFSKVAPRPLLFGTKATEGTGLVDGKFVRFFAGMKQIGVRRLAYHFHRKSLNPNTQAQFFINTIKPHITDQDILALDVEEGGETAAQLKTWCEYVMAALPRNMLWIYSSKLILANIPAFLRFLLPGGLTDRFMVWLKPEKSALDGIQMTMAEREFFRDIPTWIAGYPVNPDLYASTPSFYIPDQTKWGPVYAWQYSAHGAIVGIQGDVDLSYLSPVAVALLESPAGPSPVTYGYSKVRRYESYVHIVKVENFENALVTDTDGRLVTVSEAARGHAAAYGINGDGWYSISGNLPLSLAASDGELYQAEQYDFRPFVNISQDKEIAISHNREMVTPYNLVSGTRYLVKAGINAFVNSTDPEHVTELNPRSAIGHTADGELILCVVDGRSLASAGVTLRQLANILIEAGAEWAIEMDGGGSSALWVKDKIVNIPSDGPERAVVNHLIIMEAGMNGTAKETLGNKTTVRRAPSRYGVDTGNRIEPFTAVEFIEIVPAVVTGTADSPLDLWLKLPDGNYINYFLAGKKYYNILSIPTTEPEPTTPAGPGLPDLPVAITLGDDVAYIKQTINVILRPK